MKKVLLAAAAALVCTLAIANETPRWLRQNAISPDGNTVAFVYQGDIWLVPATGGEAVQLTTTEGVAIHAGSLRNFMDAAGIAYLIKNRFSRLSCSPRRCRQYCT